MNDLISKRFSEHVSVVQATLEHLSGGIAAAAELMIESYRSGGGVFLFGNGGSAADAQHIACELVGRFLLDRPPMKAWALSTDTSILTCLANDYSYEVVFARQLQAGARPGDVAVGLSTSGRHQEEYRPLYGLDFFNEGNYIGQQINVECSHRGVDLYADAN
ncbi:hypothetical protein LCGC14_2663080, partial [marine sediment metagenome]